MKFFHGLLISLLVLSGCLGSQAPAPVVHYGTGDGEGSAGVHNVIAGDTLWSVSQRYDILMPDIIAYNDLNAPFRLEVGQRLRLPPPREYVVRAGDTLYAISRIFEVGINDVARMNHIRAPYAIKPGQVLKLPSVSAPQQVKVASAAQSSSAGIGKPAAKPARASSVKKAASKKARSKITSRTPARSSSKFLKPVKGKLVSSYGPKKGGLHNDGINIAAARGTPVAAAENGVVVYVGDELKGSGNLILVRHADRWMSAYAHLDKTSVTRGQVLKRGQTIGTVGSSGGVKTPQLHFELRRGTRAINPERYI